jgi:hypothetical protein
MLIRPGCLWNRTREQGVAIGSRKTGKFRNQQVAGSIPAVGSIFSTTYEIPESALAFFRSIPEAETGRRMANFCPPPEASDEARAIPGTPIRRFEAARERE